MTITAEQLDELERLSEMRWPINEGYIETIADALPQLVAIARAALAWRDADDARRELAKRARADMSIMAEFMLMDDDESYPSDRAVRDALRALYVATRGTP